MTFADKDCVYRRLIGEAGELTLGTANVKQHGGSVAMRLYQANLLIDKATHSMVSQMVWLL